VSSLLRRSVPAGSVERILRGLLRYCADAVMLQLMGGGRGRRLWKLTEPTINSHRLSACLIAAGWIACEAMPLRDEL
jgi:hypothetical protein